MVSGDRQICVIGHIFIKDSMHPELTCIACGKKFGDLQMYVVLINQVMEFVANSCALEVARGDARVC